MSIKHEISLKNDPRCHEVKNFRIEYSLKLILSPKKFEIVFKPTENSTSTKTHALSATPLISSSKGMREIIIPVLKSNNFPFNIAKILESEDRKLQVLWHTIEYIWYFDKNDKTQFFFVANGSAKKI